MPNSKQHREKVNHNQGFLAAISIKDFPDWAAVVAFYVAVHLVERLRTLLPSASDQHSTSHQDRLQFVQTHHRGIHTEYHELYNASIIARYETVGSFNTQFSLSSVENKLIKNYLDTIEKYVANRFPPPTGATGS